MFVTGLEDFRACGSAFGFCLKGLRFRDQGVEGAQFGTQKEGLEPWMAKGFKVSALQKP